MYPHVFGFPHSTHTRGLVCDSFRQRAIIHADGCLSAQAFTARPEKSPIIPANWTQWLGMEKKKKEAAFIMLALGRKRRTIILRGFERWGKEFMEQNYFWVCFLYFRAICTYPSNGRGWHGSTTLYFYKELAAPFFLFCLLNSWNTHTHTLAFSLSLSLSRSDHWSLRSLSE